MREFLPGDFVYANWRGAVTGYGVIIAQSSLNLNSFNSTYRVHHFEESVIVPWYRDELKLMNPYQSLLGV